MTHPDCGLHCTAIESGVPAYSVGALLKVTASQGAGTVPGKAQLCYPLSKENLDCRMDGAMVQQTPGQVQPAACFFLFFFFSSPKS